MDNMGEIEAQDVNSRNLQDSQTERPLVPEPTSLVETPESKAIKLLANIKEAEVDSFQEYTATSNRQNGGFLSEMKENTGIHQAIRPGDIIGLPQGLSTSDSRAVVVETALEDEFSLPRSIGYSSEKRYGDMLVAVGRHGDEIVLQGAGDIGYDTANRMIPASWKVVFDSQQPAQEFTQWLAQKPNEALSEVLGRAIGKYSEDGKFQDTLLPSNTPNPGRVSPFALPIVAIHIKFLGSRQIINKSFNNTEEYNTVRKTIYDSREQAKEEALNKIFEQKQPEANQHPPTGDLNFRTTTTSRLNTDAPLTKLVNLARNRFAKNK